MPQGPSPASVQALLPRACAGRGLGSMGGPGRPSPTPSPSTRSPPLTREFFVEQAPPPTTQKRKCVLARQPPPTRMGCAQPWDGQGGWGEGSGKKGGGWGTRGARGVACLPFLAAPAVHPSTIQRPTRGAVIAFVPHAKAAKLQQPHMGHPSCPVRVLLHNAAPSHVLTSRSPPPHSHTHHHTTNSLITLLQCPDPPHPPCLAA